MELFCRKRSYSTSPPLAEVTVKRCASCPENSKPPTRLREQRRVLTDFFHVKKSNKLLPAAKWNSFDDVHHKVLDSTLPKTLGQIEGSELSGCKIFFNPLYQPPVSKMSLHSDSSTGESQNTLPVEEEEIESPPAELSSCLEEKPQDHWRGVKEKMTDSNMCETSGSLERRIFAKLHADGAKWKRKESKFVHTQPLYQDYWVFYSKDDPGVAISSFSLNTSLSIAGFISSSLAGGATSHICPRNYTTSLWQELSEVKSQKILDRISPRQRQLQEAIFEVVTSEASYQRSLSVAIDHFLKSRKLSECLVSTDKHTLFSNLPGVKDVSERFLLDLEEGLEKDIFLSEIGDLVVRHCPSFQRVYIPYITNQMYQEKLMKHLVQDNVKFGQVLRRLEEQPVCKRQLLKSFLVLPFQRITRLKILLENILKLAQGNPQLEQSVRAAIAAVGKIVSECNEGVRSMMQTEELVLLEKRVAFQNTKSFPLISRGRVLVQHGQLNQICFQEVVAGQRLRLSSKPIYLHLFSDLLLLSRRTDDGRFLVDDYAGVGQVKADQFKAKALGLPDHAFLLRLLRNHAGVSCELILEASSAMAKQQWASLISSHMAHQLSCPTGEVRSPMTL